MGAVFSGEKGVYNLPQRIQWFGLVFCSVTSVTMLPGDKVTKAVRTAIVIKEAMTTNKKKVITLRMIERAKGFFISTAPGVDAARIMTSALQDLQRQVVKLLTDVKDRDQAGR